MQTVDRCATLQIPPPLHPHQSCTKLHSPLSRPTNPHAFSASMWEPCNPRYAIHPCFPTFPLALNSTARFSKTRTHYNPKSHNRIRRISTFPATTGTTAGLHNSFFKAFPYSVASIVLLPRKATSGAPSMAESHPDMGGRPNEPLTHQYRAFAFLSVIPEGNLLLTCLKQNNTP